MMYREGIREHGHLSFLNTLVSDMNDLHVRLINKVNEINYHETYRRATANIDEFRKKITDPGFTDIHICLNALYGLLLLRLKKQPISKETEIAMSTFSKLLALLSQIFLQEERGEREI